LPVSNYWTDMPTDYATDEAEQELSGDPGPCLPLSHLRLENGPGKLQQTSPEIYLECHHGSEEDQFGQVACHRLRCAHTALCR